jgi:hypothetical protein
MTAATARRASADRPAGQGGGDLNIVIVQIRGQKEGSLDQWREGCHAGGSNQEPAT